MKNIFDIYSPSSHLDRLEIGTLKSLHLVGDEIWLLEGNQKLRKDDIINLCYARETDVILVGGSLVEGMGNIHSDLDMYVLCDERPAVSTLRIGNHVEVAGEDDVVLSSSSDDKLFSTYDYYGTQGLHIDIKYYTFSQISKMFESVRNEFYTRCTDGSVYYTEFRSSLKFEEHKFLHRLGHSLPIGGAEDRLVSLLAEYPHDEYCYICFNECLIDYFVFKDLQGFMECGDFKLAADTARKLLFEVAQSYIHFFGTSNRVRKWIYHYLAILGPMPDLAERFEKLLFRGASSSDEKILFVFDSLNLMDEMLAAIALAQDRRRGFPGAEAMRSVLRRGMESRAGDGHPISKDVELIRSKYFSTQLPSLADILKGRSWNG